MGQRESRLSKKIQLALRQHGVFCFKVWGNEHMMAGLPDLICCVRGRFVGLEVKLPENREGVSKKQELVGDRITAAGGHWSVVCSVREALALVDDLGSS